MRREMITMDELMCQLREQGVEGVGEVKRCYIEGDGHVSFIKKDSGGGGGGGAKRKKSAVT